VSVSTLVCGGCGSSPPADEPYPFRCPRASLGDGGDHVLRRVLDLSAVEFPGPSAELDTFVRYRQLLSSYHLASERGLGDDDFVSLVSGLGVSFTTTPFGTSEELAKRIGTTATLWVKDETHNVAGSHKARHLFGVLLHLAVVEKVGLARLPAPPLAIASCGNAALAAVEVAAAAGRYLKVFVPVDASPPIVRRLHELGAEVTVCERPEGTAGDPTYHALLRALDDGAIPFTCQGNLNGLAIEGGETLGWEMVSAGAGLDHIVVQVGGGALASAVAQSLQESVALGALERMPAVHIVQTEGAWPLRRAYENVVSLLPDAPSDAQIRAALRGASERRAEFMWPWETVPHSIAHGILDDETYDWLAVVEAMLRTGGRPVVVGEDELVEANRAAVEATGIDVDETGSAGLAGLIHLLREGVVGPGESAAVVFTGVRR
jgi:threonine synthase